MQSLYLLLHPSFVRKKKVRLDKFRAFIAKYVSCTPEYHTFKELENLEGQYDVLICGSDQIWNFARHDDPAWFLYFSKTWKRVKKIAYAPSMADRITDEKAENLSKYLANLDAISVRESMDVEELRKYTEKKVAHVCDPVFLLSPAEWAELTAGSVPSVPYILCYFIGLGDLAPKVVKRLREMTGCKVFHINVNVRDKFDSDMNIRDASPFEFVEYIRNATYVCTNSFHCTAFSVLFQKDFVVVPKSTANNRMKSLMDKFNIGDRFITKEKCDQLTVENLKVDYSKTDIGVWVEYSKQYLKEAIEADGTDCQSGQ